MALTKAESPDFTQALERALLELGSPTQRALPVYLQIMYDVDSIALLTEEEIENGLSDIFGTAAIVILEKFYAELGRNPGPHQDSESCDIEQ